MAATYLTLSSSPALLCQIGLRIEQPLPELAAEIATLSHATRIAEHHIHATFRDPLDTVLGWRHLDSLFGDRLAIASMIASAQAAEMLREPFATETWSWLVQQLKGVPDDAGIFGCRLMSAKFGLRPPPIEIREQRLPTTFGLTIGVAAFQDGNDRVRHLTEPGFVGRLANAAVQIDSGVISRRHVELGVDSHEGWFVRSSSASAGYWIGGHRAGSARHTLYPGMTLEFGDRYGLVVLSVR